MKKIVNKDKKLSITKEKLNQLNEVQLNHFMGGRMAAATSYTSGSTACSATVATACFCSVVVSACCTHP